MNPDRRRALRRRAPLGFVLLLPLGAILAAAAPASAQIELPPLPLPLPTVTVDLPASGTLEGVGNLVQSVPEQLGGVVQNTLGGVGSGPGSDPAGARLPRTGSAYATTRGVPSSLLVRPGSPVSEAPERSYGGKLTSGFARAAGRAANLAGPIAAPFGVASIAVGLLLLASRGSGRLVKVEEDRNAVRDRLAYRL